VQFAAGGAVIPFVTLLLRDRGLDLGQISRILSWSSATLLVFPFVWGMLADRFVALNRLFIVMNVLAAAALAIMAAQSQFFALCAGFTLFYACFNPTLTLINALSFHHLTDPPAQFGRLRAWGSLGWILPFLPIALWVAAGPKPDLNFVLYLGAGCCLGMAALSFFLPHTPPGARRLVNPAAGLTYWPAIRLLLKDPNYLAVLGSFFLMAGSYSILMFYSPPYLEDLGVPRVWLGPIQAIGVVCEIVVFQWQAALLRRWNFASTILAGCLALVLRHALFGWVDNRWLLSASYILSGIVIVFYHMGVSVLVNAMARPEVRSTAQTLVLFFGQGAGPLFANWAAGKLAARSPAPFRAVFIFGAILAILAALLLAIRGKQLNSSK